MSVMIKISQFKRYLACVSFSIRIVHWIWWRRRRNEAPRISQANGVQRSDDCVHRQLTCRISFEWLNLPWIGMVAQLIADVVVEDFGHAFGCTMKPIRHYMCLISWNNHVANLLVNFSMVRSFCMLMFT